MGQLLLTCLAVVAIAQFVMGRFCLGVGVAQEGTLVSHSFVFPPII